MHIYLAETMQLVNNSRPKEIKFHALLSSECLYFDQFMKCSLSARHETFRAIKIQVVVF